MIDACQHHSTGSHSPGGVYLYVRCMKCGQLLATSEEGRRRLRECSGYKPAPVHGRECLNCGFDYYDHPRADRRISEEMVDDLRGWALIMESDADWSHLESLYSKKRFGKFLRDLLTELGEHR